MWIKAHRARHEVCLKSIVSMQAVGQVAAWQKRTDPPRSTRATLTRAVVGATPCCAKWQRCAAGPGAAERGRVWR